MTEKYHHPPSPRAQNNPKTEKKTFCKHLFLKQQCLAAKTIGSECTPAQLTPWEVVLPKGSAEWRRNHRLKNSEEFILEIIPQNRINK